MTQATKIIDALGGTSKVATALELTPSTVSSWKTSGKIPRWWMQSVSDMANDLGVDLNALPESAAA
jgi:hypothetical protein